jgi:hypothetical protein
VSLAPTRPLFSHVAYGSVVAVADTPLVRLALVAGFCSNSTVHLP